jgi:hypothetical protein
MSKQCWTAVLCLGFVSLVGGDRLLAADAERQPLDQLTASMKKEGWTEVSNGVFERRLGPTKVERLGYGREGLAWTIGELTRKIEKLGKEQESYPSADLTRTIEGLREHLAKTKRDLRKLDRAPEGTFSNVTAASASCSNICYSATADAYYLTNAAGVAAVANAAFNSACGYSGETYAYTYARATQGNTTTTHSQSDPDSGTSITSAASSTVNGVSVTGIPCLSEASAYAQSNALGISYSTSDENSSCPVPVTPMNVSISGPSWLYFTTYDCNEYTWTASVSNGSAPYTYAWYENGSYVGSGSSYTRYVCYSEYSFDLSVTATGSDARTGSDSHAVTVQWDPYDPGCGQTRVCD